VGLDWVFVGRYMFMLVHREETRRLWHHGFDSYMDHAFPMDEVSMLRVLSFRTNLVTLVDAKSMPRERSRLCQPVCRLYSLHMGP
jgi:hypothetical protein